MPITRRRFLSILAGGFAAATGDAVAADRVPFDRAAFDAALAAGGPVLVDVAATWCVTCHAQELVLRRLMQSPPYDAFTTFVVDYDTQKDIMRAFGVQQRATLIAYRNGVEVGRLVFDARPESIEALLAAAA
jgi:thiol-disulfide isomerase/thioredoxin